MTEEIVILHVTEAFAGGTLTSLSRITRGLASPFRHIVLHGRRGDTAPEYRKRFSEQTHLIEWKVKHEIGLKNDIAALAQLDRVIADAQPCIVHAHSSKAGALARLSSAPKKSRVLYSPRGYSFQRTDIPSWFARGFWMLEAMLGLRRHLTIACGENELAMARTLTRRAVRIDNMVELPQITVVRKEVELGEPLKVAMLGHIAPAKNFPLLVEIARACELRGYQFVWVGGGEVPAGIRLPANLKMTGMLPHEAAVNAVADSHIYIHTSQWEGLSNAVLEALALGMPVVVSPASSEAVIECAERRNGFVCKSVGDYVAALSTFAVQPEMITAFGRNSRKLMEERYAADVVLAKWSELYMRVAQAPSMSDFLSGVVR